MTVPVACPWCVAGVVLVERASWETPMGRRGGVWVDDPVRCSMGCVLHPEDVQRLLLRVLDTRVRQASLMEPEGATVRQLALWAAEGAAS